LEEHGFEEEDNEPPQLLEKEQAPATLEHTWIQRDGGCGARVSAHIIEHPSAATRSQAQAQAH
jgi:hypothetical protein